MRKFTRVTSVFAVAFLSVTGIAVSTIPQV